MKTVNQNDSVPKLHLKNCYIKPKHPKTLKPSR